MQLFVGSHWVYVHFVARFKGVRVIAVLMNN